MKNDGKIDRGAMSQTTSTRIVVKGSRTIEKTIFRSCTVTGNGGAILSEDEGATLKIYNCEFDACTATEEGGSVFCKAHIELFRSCHYKNTAKNQGASVAKPFEQDSAIASMVTVCQCGTDITEEDAFFMCAPAGMSLSHLNSTLNQAKLWGSGWSLSGTPATIKFCLVRKCQHGQTCWFGHGSTAEMCIFRDNPVPAFRGGWGGVNTFNNCFFRDSWGWAKHHDVDQRCVFNDCIIVSVDVATIEISHLLTRCQFAQHTAISMYAGCHYADPSKAIEPLRASAKPLVMCSLLI